MTGLCVAVFFWLFGGLGSGQVPVVHGLGGMRKIPWAGRLDSTLPILTADGYDYIRNVCARLKTDIFETRLMLQKAICIKGAEATELFYDNDRFIRHGAVPARILNTLLGRGGVHSLDDEAHRHRKRMFMSLMTDDNLSRMEKISSEVWSKRVSEWEKKDHVILHEESQKILCEAICQWAGVPLGERDLGSVARDMGAMVDAFGAVGPRHLRGRLARLRIEMRMTKLIRQIRSGKVKVSPNLAAHVIAFHKGLDGKYLDPKVAAVELINVIRPTVAVSYMIDFCALALNQYPEYRSKLQSGGDQENEWFVQEVRRFYPFAPFMGALVRKNFIWKGFSFPKGRLVILDLYGTNHDARVWKNPDRFWPERFRNWNESAYNFIPQGGGDHFLGHRCAGEWLTIQQLKIATKVLAQEIEYTLPEQDLEVPKNRMPTLPESKVMLTNIRKLSEPAKKAA